MNKIEDLPTCICGKKLSAKHCKLCENCENISRLGKLKETKLNKILTKDFLNEHYINKKLNCKEIGEIVGCSYGTILYNLKKQGIKVKTTGESRIGLIRSKEFGIKMSKISKNFYSNPENHPNWIDGRTILHSLIRTSWKYAMWRVTVIRKDNYKCVKCDNYTDVEAHHKIRFAVILNNFLKLYSQYSPIEDTKKLVKLANKYKPFWDIDNGETLCFDCHSQIKVDNRINARTNN